MSCVFSMRFPSRVSVVRSYNSLKLDPNTDVLRGRGFSSLVPLCIFGCVLRRLQLWGSEDRQPCHLDWPGYRRVPLLVRGALARLRHLLWARGRRGDSLPTGTSVRVVPRTVGARRRHAGRGHRRGPDPSGLATVVVLDQRIEPTEPCGAWVGFSGCVGSSSATS